MSSKIVRGVGGSLVLWALCQAAPAVAVEPVRHDLGTFEGVQAQWWVVQELKDQFRATWSFQNTTAARIEFSYTIVFECSGGPGNSTRMGLKLKPGERKAGQWEGMWSYPCKGTPPTGARIEKFTNLEKPTGCDPATTKVEVRLTSGGELGAVKITRGSEVITKSRQSILQLMEGKEKTGKGATLPENAPGLVLKSANGELVVVDLEFLRAEFCGAGAVPGDASVLEAVKKKLKESIESAVKEHCAKSPHPAQCEVEARGRTRVAGGVRD